MKNIFIHEILKHFSGPLILISCLQSADCHLKVDWLSAEALADALGLRLFTFTEFCALPVACDPYNMQVVTNIFHFSCREYIKIFDGNGKEVFTLSGWLSSFKKTIHEISFGQSKNITIQASLVSSWSYVKIDYGTLNQGLDSGKVYNKCINHLYRASNFFWSWNDTQDITVTSFSLEE